MTIPVSTVTAARTYLFTQIGLMAALDVNPTSDRPPLVCYGPHGKNPPEEIIEIGCDASQDAAPTQMVGSGGAGWLFEAYTISVNVAVWRAANGDPQGADELVAWQRCSALSDGIDQLIRSDPTCGGLTYLSYPSRCVMSSQWDDGSPWDITGTGSAKGRIVAARKEIHFQAEL